MLNDVELQARIDNFLHRKESQFPEISHETDAKRGENGLNQLRLGASPSK